MLNNYTANTERVIGKSTAGPALWESQDGEGVGGGGGGGQSKAMAMTEVMNLLAGPLCN